MASNPTNTRYFLTYHGVALPLSLSVELEPRAVMHRGTYFKAHYDQRGRMVRCEKLVYGEIEFEHEYEYDTAGRLQQARITHAGEEPQVVSFQSRLDS
jgi:hypothetical protein